MAFKKLVVVFRTLRNSINFTAFILIVSVLVSSNFYPECQCQEHQNYPVQIMHSVQTPSSTSEKFHAGEHFTPSDYSGHQHDSSSDKNQEDFYYPDPTIAALLQQYTKAVETSQLTNSNNNFNHNHNDNYYDNNPYQLTQPTASAPTTTTRVEFSNANAALNYNFNPYENSTISNHNNYGHNFNENSNYHYSEENLAFGQGQGQGNGRDSNALPNYDYISQNEVVEPEAPKTVAKIRIVKPPNAFQKMKRKINDRFQTHLDKRRRTEFGLGWPEDPRGLSLGETLMQTAMMPATFFAFSMIFMDIMHRLVPIPTLPNIFNFGFGSPTTTTTPAPRITKIEFKPPQIPDIFAGIKSKLAGLKNKKGKKKGFLDSSEEDGYSYRRRRLPLGKRRGGRRKKKKEQSFSVNRLKKLYKKYLPSNAMG